MVENARMGTRMETARARAKAWMCWVSSSLPSSPSGDAGEDEKAGGLLLDFEEQVWRLECEEDTDEDCEVVYVEQEEEDSGICSEKMETRSSSGSRKCVSASVMG